MGHYDSCYEATERVEEQSRRADLIRWISEIDFHDMTTEELIVLHHVAEDIEDFTAMQRFMRNLNGL